MGQRDGQARAIRRNGIDNDTAPPVADGDTLFYYDASYEFYVERSVSIELEIW